MRGTLGPFLSWNLTISFTLDSQFIKVFMQRTLIMNQHTKNFLCWLPSTKLISPNISAIQTDLECEETVKSILDRWAEIGSLRLMVFVKSCKLCACMYVWIYVWIQPRGKLKRGRHQVHGLSGRHWWLLIDSGQEPCVTKLWARWPTWGAELWVKVTMSW